MNPLSPTEFAELMAGLGRFEASAPRLAVAVSGGPDSMALALLAADWALRAGGEAVALILDHGLRREAAEEAAITASRLAGRGVRTRVLRLRGLAAGPGTPARARAARLGMLEAAAAELGIAVLLFGHHAADQAETLLLRAIAGSDRAGLAGMAPRRETARVVLLRPLLGVSPGRLRATLAAANLDWVTDPSNADIAFGRARLRRWRADAAGEGVATEALAEAALTIGRMRAATEREQAAMLAERASLHPEGYALLTPGPLAPAALARLLRALSGAGFAPSLARVAALAATPRAATIAGIRLLPAGRLGVGWLLVREAASMAPSVPAIPGVLWDGRFRLACGARPPPGARLGALGRAATCLRRHSSLPGAVLATLPALRVGEKVVAVPHLGYPDRAACAAVPVLFSPREPAAGAPFAIVLKRGGAESDA